MIQTKGVKGILIKRFARGGISILNFTHNIVFLGARKGVFLFWMESKATRYTLRETLQQGNFQSIITAVNGSEQNTHTLHTFVYLYRLPNGCYTMND